jgi:hypothetical protein
MFASAGYGGPPQGDEEERRRVAKMSKAELEEYLIVGKCGEIGRQLAIMRLGSMENWKDSPTFWVAFISAVAAIAALVIGWLAWQRPKEPVHEESKATEKSSRTPSQTTPVPTATQSSEAILPSTPNPVVHAATQPTSTPSAPATPEPQKED